MFNKNLNINFISFFFIKNFFFKLLLKDVKYYFNNLFLFVGFIDYNIITLPIKVKKFTVVRSPFVSKLSREQFEIRTYKSIVTVSFNNSIFIKQQKSKILDFFRNSYVFLRLKVDINKYD